MCGLLAILNKNSNGFSADQNDHFSTLLFLDLLRGNDSTGVVCVTNNGDLALAKEASHSLDFMASKEYTAIMNRSFNRGSALIGHNRKATRGTVNDENAHPFVVDNNIVLVHNGTLWGDHKKHADTEVDSHAIAHVIHESNGDVQAALNKIDGAYALIWYNVADATVNFVRNKERPLWWMETYNSWVFSSEKAMLDFVIARHKIHPSKGPTEFPENVLQTFALQNNGGWKESSQKIEIKSKSYSGQTAFYPTVAQLHNRGHRGHNEDFYMNGGMDNDDDGAMHSRASAHSTTPASSSGPYDGMTMDQRERILAKGANKILTNAEYMKDVLSMYNSGAKILVEPFDYIEDTTLKGYWLYSSPLEDPSVIVKHFFPGSQATEERVIQIASGDYIFEMTISSLRWSPLVDGGFRPNDYGYVMLTVGRAEIIHGGGIGSMEEVQRRTANKPFAKTVH